jgi:hypothetical protein
MDSAPVPDHVRGLWCIAAAIAYPVAGLPAERRYGVTGLLIAGAACVVLQFAVVEPAERRRRRARANFATVADALATVPEPKGGRFACPCCGCLTLGDEPPGTSIICGVCFWEDDGVQFRDPDYEGGARDQSEPGAAKPRRPRRQ